MPTLGGGDITEEGDDVTVDTLFRGRVTLLQPARGFRSSLDAVLLATFVRPPFGRFVDVGCATGAVALSLAAMDAEARGVGVEIQPRLAALARRGLARNELGGRVSFEEGDIRRLVGQAPLERAGFDLVVSNPPFRPLAGGVVSPDPEIAHAHHEAWSCSRHAASIRLTSWRTGSPIVSRCRWSRRRSDAARR